MKKKILGQHIEPRCEYCTRSVVLNNPGALLCPRAGITGAADCCKRFKYDPLKRKPKAAPALMQFTDQDFSLE